MFIFPFPHHRRFVASLPAPASSHNVHRATSESRRAICTIAGFFQDPNAAFTGLRHPSSPNLKRFLKPASRPHPSLNIPSSRPIHNNIFPCDSRTVSKLLPFPQASHKPRILDIKQPQALTLNISRAPQALQYARSRAFQSGICSPAARRQVFAWLPLTTPSDCFVPLRVCCFGEYPIHICHILISQAFLQCPRACSHPLRRTLRRPSTSPV
jgi:hypothetical protein